MHRIKEKLVIIVYMKGVSINLPCPVLGRCGLKVDSGISAHLQGSDIGYGDQANGTLQCISF
jgi:hypothetical protein